MGKKTSIFLLLTGVLAVFAACGSTTVGVPVIPSDPTLGTPDASGVVIKSRVLVPVSAATGSVSQALLSQAQFAVTSGSQSINVVSAANTSMSIDSSQWVAPAISNTVLDFGLLGVADLFDNNLSVCGTNGKSHCSFAVLRMYTTGVSGPGVWNSADQFGAPVRAGLNGVTPAILGLEKANAVSLQQISIPANKHVLRYSDFSPAPRFKISADFTEAGAGTYNTTLVLEYVLLP